ncbi:MAG: restriction endonuclease subunit R, partial [Pseudomonadales bacterium]
EGDMRQLLNTYIKAEPAEQMGAIDKYSLVELVIETGIHDAIAKKLNAKGRLSNNAIAEGIINNVRKTIIREQLADPRFYEEMSRLLDDLIQKARDDAASYEEFLQKAEALIQQLASKHASTGDVPFRLQGKPEAYVLFRNLEKILAAVPGEISEITEETTEIDRRIDVALAIDRVMREHAPAGWLGDETREKQVLNALFPIMGRNRPATLAVFDIIRNLPGYQ